TSAPTSARPPRLAAIRRSSTRCPCDSRSRSPPSTTTCRCSSRPTATSRIAAADDSALENLDRIADGDAPRLDHPAVERQTAAALTNDAAQDRDVLDAA